MGGFLGLEGQSCIEPGYKYVAHPIRDGYLEFSQRKTGDAERLPLSDEAKRILKRQEGAQPSPNLHRTFPENAVFFMPKQSVVDKQLKKWAKDAGITKTISFHKSRHTFAPLALSSGVDLYTTSKLLGHRNIQTTQIYAKVVDEKKKQAVAMLPTLEGDPSPRGIQVVGSTNQ
jgi:site-specific recombinase XerD